MVMLELINSYRGNRSQLYSYVCKHVYNKVSSCTDYMFCSELIPKQIQCSQDLTTLPIEDMIDLAHMDPWSKYLLWQSGVEEQGIRNIARLTGISKSVIADDLRYIHGSF